MKRYKYWIVVSVILYLACVPSAFAKVSADEAAKLGTTLTGIGAEKAGNKDGTIPEYTGGIQKIPANYVKGSGVLVDPFPEDKPLFSITAQNMQQYIDKLSSGAQAMLKKYPTFRMDIYKTRRSVAIPDWVIANTKKLAVTAETTAGGYKVANVKGGFPFPIPKTGNEAMFNHFLAYRGISLKELYNAWVVDPSGRLILTSYMEGNRDYPYYQNDASKVAEEFYMRGLFWFFNDRMKGQAFLLMDRMDQIKGRIAYQYLPGQRRIKLAPEIAFDGLDLSTAGNNTYDENSCFDGSLERYNWKLIGKKEMYIPYNTYRTWAVDPKNLYTKNFANPDYMRWELHRVWVVEATLRPGKRHIYPRRILYLDEDSWQAITSDLYDARGTLIKANFAMTTPHYELKTAFAEHGMYHNLLTGSYATAYAYWGNAKPKQYRIGVKPPPDSHFTPSYVAGSGVR